MPRTARAPSAPPRLGALMAAGGAVVWLLLMATLRALWRVDEAPTLTQWSDVSVFVWWRVFGLLPATWGVRGQVAVAFALASLLACFAPRAWRCLFAEEGPRAPTVRVGTWLGDASIAAAGACVLSSRAAVVAGLRGPASFALAALCFVTWTAAERATLTTGALPLRRQALVLGLSLAACAASPVFLLVLGALPAVRATIHLRSKGVLVWLVAGFVFGLLLAGTVFALAHTTSVAPSSGALAASEAAPGLAHVARLFRLAAEALGVVAGLVVVVGFWFLFRERRPLALGSCAAILVLVLVPGQAVEGTRLLLLLWLLALALSAGIFAIARAFGRAAFPAALVLSFVCLAWPALDGMGRIVAAHRNFRAGNAVDAGAARN